MAGALAAGALLASWATAAPASAEPPTVTLAIVRGGVDPSALSREGMSIGLLSAGIGEVTAEETYRDISAGNREPPPSDAVSALLESTLAAHRLRDRYRRVSANPAGLSRLVAGLRGADLLIAIAAPPPAPNRALPIGIAGEGFDGDLTSDSTRTGGYVLSTDVAPTILNRLGSSIPDEMDGDPIRAEGRVDPGAVEDLGDRIAVIPERRVPLLVACLAAWIALALAVNRIVFGLRRVAIAWLALCIAYLPLMLLAGAWLDPGAVAEGLLVGFGAAVLAALTVRFAWGWGAVAIACAITVTAYAIDVIAGSGLTRLSLLGPNPIYGVRFYGIGNELEALLAVMVPVGVGAGLTAKTGWGKGMSRRASGAAFLGVAAVAALVFAAGRFGADVGAAITLAVGAAVAAAALPDADLVEFSGYRPENQTNLSRHGLFAAVIGAPFIALLFLALIDLVSGANAHLTHSVLDAGGAGDLADVAERRLRLSAHDFAQAAGNPLFWAVVAGIAVAISQWRRIDAWLHPAPLVRAGFFGACAAVAAGVLVNDSGATFLTLGGLALGAVLCFASAQAPGTDP